MKAVGVRGWDSGNEGKCLLPLQELYEEGGEEWKENKEWTWKQSEKTQAEL